MYLILFLQLLGLNSTDWEIASSNGPESRYINQLAQSQDGLLLFGGKNSGDGFNDLWQWKDDKWHYKGEGATKRWDHSFVYMMKDKQLFLFGGRSFEILDGKKQRIDLVTAGFIKTKNGSC